MTKFIAAFVAICVLSCNSANNNTASQADTSTTTSTAANLVSAPTPDTVISSTKAALDFAYGIDISKYQGDEIEFISRKQDTLTFVICKATQGLTIIDPDFKNNWDNITQKGFVRGAYHFYQSQDDPLAQAKHFLSVVTLFAKRDFPPIIDFEETSIAAGESIEQIQQNLLTFLNEVALRTGRKPIIYTDNNTGGKYLNNPAFQQYHLFIADYDNTAKPRLPRAWTKWALWQKSESYKVHSTTDDFDMFNGSFDDLNRFISSN